jgi:hypothetical protein
MTRIASTGTAAAFACLLACLPASAQDARAWLESQGLAAVDVKTFEDLEVAVAAVKGAAVREEKVVVLRQGRPLWQTTAKDAPPGSRWTLHMVGRDLDGDGRPDMHLSSFSGGAHCCTTHYVVQLKPQPRRLASYAAGNVGGGEFIDVAGRKAPVLVSADDAGAGVFAPYATSYFPAVILEVTPRGRMQFARDLMQSRLPGQPPPVCGTLAPAANAWLRERCNEFTAMRRQERTAYVKSRLEAVKADRSVERLKWEDYYDAGVLGAVAAELNRYSYTGHGNAGVSWLETVWPGNDPVKMQLLAALRQAHAKSVFADDLRALALAR